MAESTNSLAAAAATAGDHDAVMKKYLQSFYREDLGDLPASTREVLENYSKIPKDEVMPHVYAVRDKAFAIYPYPCIGAGRFLHLALGRHALYPEILERMRTGTQVFLDLGCAFAQDIRRLVADGVDGKQCYGADLRLDFLELGYELFRDKDTLGATFIAADIFDPASPLAQLDGKVDIIDTSSFFHLFDRERQLQVARRCVQLLKPQKDSLIVGRQRASRVAGEVARKSDANAQPRRYLHSAESWQQFWEEIGRETGAEFKVQVEMLSDKFERPDDQRETDGVSMSFSVRRL